jgi:hypothetical protein
MLVWVVKAIAMLTRTKPHLWRADKHWSTVIGFTTSKVVVSISVTPAPAKPPTHWP